ncbi:hypothetical protein H0H81_004250 [Sphagnurus paluster]|uniref:Uncharacterized protein n=1 Tax=Sphagnurus paluster TaxID=117069 RepID=A0A9P7GQ90_9AGAR|nr:hypothetical protein H0H81_004250 [Sphagnurus paluster]
MITQRKVRSFLCVGIIVVIFSALLTWRRGIYHPKTLTHNRPPLPIRHDKVTVTPSDTKVHPDTQAPSHATKETTKDATEARKWLTSIPEGAHVEGFTLIDNLYMRNGTFYIVTPHKSKFPPMENVLSQPLELGTDANMEPTDKEIQFLGAEDVESILGKHSIRIKGHYYHWWGEIILGLWRVLSFEGAKTNTVLTPARFLLPFSVNGAFRDHAGVDAPLMRAAFPHAPIEESDYWNDYINLNTTVLFDQVMLVNRPATHRHPWANRWFKMIAGTMNVTVPETFWAPVRQSLVQNMLGYLPEAQRAHGHGANKPLVTYISRQGSRRRLEERDHEALVKELADLEEEGLCEFREARMERMSLIEQIELVARSTVSLAFQYLTCRTL